MLTLIGTLLVGDAAVVSTFHQIEAYRLVSLHT